MRLRFSTVLVAFAVVAGCSYGPEDYCQDLCDCEGCSDDELADCIDDAEDLYDSAVHAGCEDLADDYLACLGDEVECRGDDFDADGCEREYQDGLDCIGDTGIEGDDGDDESTSSGDAGTSGGAGAGGGPSIAPWCDVPAQAPSQGSCVSLGGDIGCNPITNEPCGADEMVCDAIGTPSDGFQCYSVSSQSPLCAPCDSPCQPGTLCTGDLDLPTVEHCAKVCCDDGDCGGGICVKQGVAVAGADIGVCLASAL